MLFVLQRMPALSPHQHPPPSSSRVGLECQSPHTPSPKGPTQRQTDRMFGNEQKWRKTHAPVTGSLAQVSSPTYHSMTHQQVPRIEPPGSATIPVNKWARAHPLLRPTRLQGTISMGLGIPVLAFRGPLSSPFVSSGLSLPSYEMGIMIPNTWRYQL